LPRARSSSNRYARFACVEKVRLCLLCSYLWIKFAFVMNRPALRTTLVVVFIANEEASAGKGIGIDQLVRDGYLDSLKAGPVFWVDASDRQPCVGTAGMIQWKMKTHGRLFHSGLPHKGINSIEMAFDAMNYIQDRFYTDFPRHPLDDKYNFLTASTMKPTHVRSADGSLNQIPSLCTVSGDIRLSPFYKMVDAKRAVESYVAAINADPSGVLERNLHGPHSKYDLPEEGERGELDFQWIGEGEDGIACNMDSAGFRALSEATSSILGEALHYSIGGSLPLVRWMQSDGFDIQIVGYGMSAAYHANDECAHLSHYKQATKIFAKVRSIRVVFFFIT
jgi:acetylornithine deacetylase